MIPILDSQKEDLKFLQNQPVQIFGDFCKLVWNYINKGPNIKLYQTASQKLHINVKEIQSGVEALAFLFIEAGKYQANEEDFKEAITKLEFPEESFDVIYSEYSNQKTFLEKILPQAGIQHPQFKDLHWRFEAQLSSRSLKNQIQPRIVMKLELEKDGETKALCLQSDIPNIMHMSQVLSQALQESKTQHSKRILRAIS